MGAPRVGRFTNKAARHRAECRCRRNAVGVGSHLLRVTQGRSVSGPCPGLKAATASRSSWGPRSVSRGFGGAGRGKLRHYEDMPCSRWGLPGSRGCDDSPGADGPPDPRRREVIGCGVVWGALISRLRGCCANWMSDRSGLTRIFHTWERFEGVEARGERDGGPIGCRDACGGLTTRDSWAPAS